MESSILLRQLLRTPSSYRTIMTPAMRPQTRAFTLLAPTLPHARYISLPRIIQPSFWASMIPRPFKSRSTHPAKGWNPATSYILLGLLVGSQAIHMLWLKQDRAHYMRRAEAKIGLLREVVERVQSGEEVDVEKVLGTGVEGEEREWEEVVREIGEEEELFRSKKRRRAERRAAGGAEIIEKAEEVEAAAESETVGQEGDRKAKVETYKGASFY
ncbi:hypothetical protein BDV95DRAFT_501700 [Massariosphaeria phaeospora]|uniref:Uncharacterized protein n=1 Tax=Massariosphaeria phaeospora TaxID=100035 RepID=A0A7C8I8M5_9PLEO|nr:hypothetical protein BDV95DRAFT_501700 [Massariosphaeria phaeospora]